MHVAVMQHSCITSFVFFSYSDFKKSTVKDLVLYSHAIASFNPRPALHYSHERLSEEPVFGLSIQGYRRNKDWL